MGNAYLSQRKICPRTLQPSFLDQRNVAFHTDQYGYPSKDQTLSKISENRKSMSNKESIENLLIDPEERSDQFFRRNFHPSPMQLYKDLREKWVHEDGLINQRVTWLLTYQAFLFTAFGVIVQIRFGFDETIRSDSCFWRVFSPYSLGELVIVLNAVITIRFLRKGIVAAVDAMELLNCKLREHKDTGRIWSDARIEVFDHTTIAGAGPAKVLARSFEATWWIIVTYEFCRTLLRWIWPALPIV